MARKCSNECLSTSKCYSSKKNPGYLDLLLPLIPSHRRFGHPDLPFAPEDSSGTRTTDPAGIHRINDSRAPEQGLIKQWAACCSLGVWQPAVNLANFNSSALDYCPFVTWDRKYLFFTSSRASYKSPFNKRQSIEDLKKGLSNPGNGLDDIYWVRFDNVLNRFKK